jgi:CRISPR/Cas system CSM-associated protein Csm2 small subunit
MFLNKDTLPLIKKIEKKSETIDSFCKISNGIVAYKK